MTPFLFVAPCPLKASTTQPKTCIRRPRTFACATNPKDQDIPNPNDQDISNAQDREIGEPSWMDLARDISPTDSDDAPSPPPKWEYPEGDPNIPADDQNNAWKAWKAAVEKETPLEERNVKAETDFWRSAARDLTDENDDSQTKPSEPTIAARPDDILTDEPSKSEDVWRMARGVTGEMTELQQKLRSELERYNPDENTDQYRDIARELVGPPEEPWENSNPIRTSEAEAEAGSGWNPDVDWMRFDDMRREQAKKAEAASRKEAHRVAREQMETLRDHGPESFSGVDDELTRTFTDQSVDESYLQETPIENLPGFLTNRMRRSGTYGGAWSGAEEEAQNLQKQGIPLRDPQADTDKWRGVAKELSLEDQAGSEKPIPGEVKLEENGDNIESEADQAGSEKPIPGEVKLEENGDNIESEAGGELDDVVGELEEIVLGEESSENVKSSGDIDEETSWSSWRSGSAKWEAANEKAEARDPAKEVDMWRSSAREVTSTTLASEQSTIDAQSDVAGTDKTPKDEGSAWDQWRSANAQWESSISGTTEDSRQMRETKWGNADQSDWGAGLGSKTTSERSAWEQWNNVSGMGATPGSSSWWSNRTDSSLQNEDKPDRSYNNADEWRSIAREALNLPEKQVDNVPESREERIEKDNTLDSWRSIAKDLIEDHD